MAAKRLTKSQVIAELAEITELDKKSVSRVFEGLGEVIKKQLGARGPGEFVIPGLLKLKAVKKLLRTMAKSYRHIDRLVVLRLPLADLYENHWSVTGCQTPDADTPDDAVYLPGGHGPMSDLAFDAAGADGGRDLRLN